MVRRVIATVALGLVAAACGAPRLSSTDAVDLVRSSLANAGVTATNVHLVDDAGPGTFRAVATVKSSRVVLVVDRSSRGFRRIEEKGDALTDRQLHAIAQQRASNQGVRAQQFLGAVVALLVAFAVAVGLARRARLREERASSTVVESAGRAAP